MREKFKKFIKRHFVHFSYFYIQLRYRIFIALGLSLLVGVLDGFGLAMFFPLLEAVDGSNTIEGEGLGGLSFIIDAFNKLGIPLTVYSVLFIIAFFFILKGVAKFLEQYYNVVTQQYFIRKLRYESVDKLGGLQFKKFVMSDVGRIQNTLSGEVGRVSQAYRFYFMAIQAGVLVFVYVLLAVFADPQFSILVILGGGMSNLLYNRIYRKTKETSKNITTGGHQFQGRLLQMVSFLKYFKATGTIKTYVKKLKSSIDFIELNTKRIGLYNSILVATREPLVISVVVLIILVQVSFFAESIGAIILSLLFFYRSLTSLMQMQNQWNSFLNMSGSLENTTSFLKELRSSQEKNGEIIFDHLKNGLTIRSGNFRYGKSHTLKDINLVIPKNKTVAIVGESGSGKTTLVNVLTGLIPLLSGEYLIDKIPIEELDTATFQKNIGYITQEPVIFDETIFNNVTFWDIDNAQNKERFWNALSLASIDDFVRSHPLKENASLGNSGVLISGGQKQRLSIARELYKKTDILIMDEATSALDSETERAIQENIDTIKGKFTVIIVAHRLSTIKNADMIIVMKSGEIIARGDYNELISSSPDFQKMVSYQQV